MSDAVMGVEIPGDRTRTQTLPRDRLRQLLVLFLALVPLPLASNRPVFWGISAACIGTIGAWYVLARPIPSAGRPPSERWLLGVALLFVALCLFLIVQILPLGLIAPISVLPRLGDPVALSALSLSPGATSLTLLQMASYGALFYLAAEAAQDAGRGRALLQAVFGIAGAYAVFALVALNLLGDTLLGMPKASYAGAATGSFVNANSFATLLAFGLVAGLPLLLDSFTHRAGPRHTGLIALGLAVVGAALLATRSRMGVTAGLCGLAMVVVLWVMWSRPGLARLLIVLGALAGFSLLLLFAFGTPLLERALTLPESAEVRAALHAQIWEMIWLRPLTGYGGGSFELAFPLFHMPPVSTDLVWDKTHSTYLALWVELGLVFGSIPLIIVAWLGSRALRRPDARGSWVTQAAVLGAITVAAVHSAVDFSLEIHANACMFAVLLALGSGRLTREVPPR